MDLPAFIHPNESWKINKVCELFNLRAEELKEIIKRVGYNIKDIEKYLEKKRLPKEPSKN
jgi:adenylosuccinate lyase